LLIFSNSNANAEDQIKEFFNGQNTRALLILDDKGKEIFNSNGDLALVPASTMKLLTVSAALDVLGPDYSFKTEIYEGVDLGVKGFSTNLNSDEIKSLAGKISKNIFRNLIIDPSFYSENIKVSGKGDSDNPYDSEVGPISANYNTVNLKIAGGRVSSAEEETPDLPWFKRFGSRLSGSQPQRISVLNKDEGYLLFSHLLKEFLSLRGIKFKGEILVAKIVGEPTFTWRSSRNLRDVSKLLLKFSTNQTANQLFFLLGAEQYGAPATEENARKVIEEFALKKLGSKIKVYDGAGLSHSNKVTPRVLTSVLKKIPLEYLPDEGKSLRAKTGTLRGVSTLAGRFEGCGVRFAMMINENVDFNLRFRLANKIKQQYCN